MVSLIVAMNERRVIGKDGALPWRLPADLRYFKTTTMGKPVIMGRRTYESIARPLPGRRNIVVTRNPDWQASGCERSASVDAALALTVDAEEVFIIGGAMLYAGALSRCERLYITHVDAPVEGDTFFPDVDLNAWRKLRDEAHDADERNPYPYRFAVYAREV